MSASDDDTKLSPKAILDAKVGDRDRAYLIVLSGSNVGEMFKVGECEEATIGRGNQSSIYILDEGISRQHARVVLEGGQIFIEDLGSRNGTYVNGQRVLKTPLGDGDKIQVGSTTILKFTYHDHLDENFQQQMYESALRDGLTKAFNKKYFMDRLDSEFKFAKRHNVPLSLIILDVDNFKNINDVHGHLAGDFVLSTLARRVQDTIRKEDVFARYGGEEFAVLCRAIDESKAAALAERLRLAVANFVFRYQSSVIPVTISLGVGSLPGPNVIKPADLIANADGALYAAKHGGRNQVQCAGPSPGDTTR